MPFNFCSLSGKSDAAGELFSQGYGYRENQKADALLAPQPAMPGRKKGWEPTTSLYEVHEKQLCAVTLKVREDSAPAEDAAQQPGVRSCGTGIGPTSWTGARPPNAMEWNGYSYD